MKVLELFSGTYTYFVSCWWCGARTDCDDRKEVVAEAWNRMV